MILERNLKLENSDDTSFQALNFHGSLKIDTRASPQYSPCDIWWQFDDIILVQVHQRKDTLSLQEGRGTIAVEFCDRLDETLVAKVFFPVDHYDGGNRRMMDDLLSQKNGRTIFMFPAALEYFSKYWIEWFGATETLIIVMIVRSFVRSFFILASLVIFVLNAI